MSGDNAEHIAVLTAQIDDLSDNAMDREKNYDYASARRDSDARYGFQSKSPIDDPGNSWNQIEQMSRSLCASRLIQFESRDRHRNRVRI
jgi:hypothetical protein